MLVYLGRQLLNNFNQRERKVVRHLDRDKSRVILDKLRIIAKSTIIPLTSASLIRKR